MINILTKIDRVGSVKEAVELQNLGVDIITIAVNNIPAFPKRDTVNIRTAKSIRDVLTKSKLAADIGHSYSLSRLKKLIKKIKFDYIQILDPFAPSNSFLNMLEQHNIGLICSGLTATYDECPSWMLVRYLDVPNINTAYYHVDLMGEIVHSWNFLKNETLKYPDEELQVGDVNEVGESNPLLITLDFTEENLIDIIQSIPSIKGICLTIANSTKRNDLHVFQYTDVLKILNLLNSH